jgi:hypothetical protein
MKSGRMRNIGHVMKEIIIHHHVWNQWPTPSYVTLPWWVSITWRWSRIFTYSSRLFSHVSLITSKKTRLIYPHVSI